MLKAYANVLSKRNFIFLWLGQIISQFGDRLTQMALIGLVYKITPASSLGLAKVMSLAVVPVFLISPLAGVYVDRWNKRATMFFSDFTRGIFILLIPLFFFWYKSLGVVYVLIFLSFCVGRFFIPAKMSIVPALVSSGDIIMANSLVSTTAMVAAMLGLGMGALIVERYGIRAAFYIDAATFFISAGCVYCIRIDEKKFFNPRDLFTLGKDAIGTLKQSFFHEAREGWRYLFQSQETRYACEVFFVLFSSIGALYVVFVVFIQSIFSTITLDVGRLAVAAGLGLFGGTVLYGRLGRAMDIKKTVNICMVLASAHFVFFTSVLAVYPSRLFAFASCVILGGIVSPITIAVNSLVHKDSDNTLWGRIFSSLEVVIHFAFIVCMFIASCAAEIFNPFTTIATTGIIMFLFFTAQLMRK